MTCFLAHEDSKKTEENAKTTSAAITRLLFMALYLPVLGYLPKFFFFASIQVFLHITS
jgi:hypothetical protein